MLNLEFTHWTVWGPESIHLAGFVSVETYNTNVLFTTKNGIDTFGIWQPSQEVV